MLLDQPLRYCRWVKWRSRRSRVLWPEMFGVLSIRFEPVNHLNIVLMTRRPSPTEQTTSISVKRPGFVCPVSNHSAVKAAVDLTDSSDLGLALPRKLPHSQRRLCCWPPAVHLQRGQLGPGRAKQSNALGGGGRCWAYKSVGLSISGLM